MGARRVGREHALMILYQIDVSALTAETALERFFTSFDNGEPLDPALPFAHAEKKPKQLGAREQGQARTYTATIVRGVRHHLERLDEAITKASSSWRIERMARVDRNILRAGAFELIHMAEEVPRNVVINEAIEIAKSFGTSESGAFINGILDKIQA
jgi:transcription antitermination protein NusB